MTTIDFDNLLEKANILTDDLKISVIPIQRGGNKRPALSTWTNRRDKRQLATKSEREEWFRDNKYNLAIILYKQRFILDLDGSESRRIFWDVLLPIQPGESIRHKISNTWRTMTPGGGEHLNFQKEESNKGNKISNNIWGTIRNADDSWNHDLLETVTWPKYIIQAGFENEIRKYQDITDMNIQTLDNEELENLLDLLQKFKVLVDSTTNIAKSLVDFYHINYRNKICWTLESFLFKYGSPEWFNLETIRRVAMYNKDTDPLESRLNTIKSTCQKDPNSAEVSGYDKLLETLTEAYNGKDDKKLAAIQTITKISGIMEEAAQIFGFEWLRGYSHTETQQQEESEDKDNELNGIYQNILLQLSSHIYAVISLNPPVLYVAHTRKKCVEKAIIKFENDEREEKNGKSPPQKITTKKQILCWKQKLIYALPTKVVINDNPLNDNRTYTITFDRKKSKKPFTIGPNTISAIIDALDKKGEVMKKPEATDALTAIAEKFEDMGLAEISNGINESGYYWIDDKIVGYNINQRLDLDPQNNEADRKAVLECIEVLEGLQERSKKKIAFPTALKWSILAPFSFITKSQSKGVDDWLPWLFLYDSTDTGKTTLIINTALAIWDKHDKERDYIHFRGPGNIDSPSKLGITVSQTTYSVLVDEIGSLLSEDNRYNNNLLDMIKYAVQGKTIRSRFGEDILALSPLAFTSNDPPPQNEAYRRRFTAIQFYENEKWTEKEKEDFKRWLEEGNRKDKLKTLGDFAARYIIKHPEVVLKYSSYLWHERSAIILREFYKSVSKEPPPWIDLIAEQTIVKEVSEERQFEIRGFLQQSILDAFRRDISTNPDAELHPPHITYSYEKSIDNSEIRLEQKMNFCLKNKSIPFLHLCKRNMGQEIEVAITSNIRSELKKYGRSSSPGLTMEALASKIPGLKYDFRNVGGQRARVICGPMSKFFEFLNCEVEEVVE